MKTKKKKVKTTIKVKKSKHAKNSITHIKKKSIKPRDSDRIPSGIPNFDGITDGGLTRGSVNLIVGGAGSGKTIFSIQFLYEGLKNGETCMYLTFEEKKDDLYRNMLKVGFNLRKYEDSGKFIFVEYTPEQVKTMIEEGGGTLESMVSKKNISRLVIDSVTSFELLFESELEKREAALALFGIIKAWKCTTFLTTEKELSINELISGSESAMEFEVDSVILIFYLRLDGIRNRMIEVLKMRGTKHSRRIYALDITENGIKISKNPEKSIKSDLI
jgi:KaiC/GvpD/RAD55 family RecA-like ATPase